MVATAAFKNGGRNATLALPMAVLRITARASGTLSSV